VVDTKSMVEKNRSLSKEKEIEYFCKALDCFQETLDKV